MSAGAITRHSDAFGLELALQREAAWPGLVAGHDRPRRHALQALRGPLHRAQLVRQLPLLGPLGPRRQHRDPEVASQEVVSQRWT